MSMKNDLIRSSVCSAVFGAVFGFVVACNTNVQPRNTSEVIRLVSHTVHNMIDLPKNLNGPFMASLFQATPQSAQINKVFRAIVATIRRGSELPQSITAGACPALYHFWCRLTR